MGRTIASAILRGTPTFGYAMRYGLRPGNRGQRAGNGCAVGFDAAAIAHNVPRGH